MATEFWSALCLVLVIEGLCLFAAPKGWKEMVRHALQMDDRSLRLVGGVMLLIGVLALHWLH